ncbi:MULTISPECIES: hypothetical protein [Legionella]|uniref:Uncharacterized protein n=1 Tax=Legionella resiliens TaxID=2905958 RepID=A0ABS8WYV8_9GAMM|nr:MULTISPECIES: hypothetical protein [unclassified Legionella]MCE0722537.1 hypothetical protein [Legionella sp. 9fVS26]MCE3531691.1 hypothetical protein [Legionella sp. 8cVS16]QLZ67714.1 protein kinase family protein [Legionella sp. PC1000]
MTKPIIVATKKSEFFITIAKNGIHSFVMLGVMVDGKPELLAKVGKGNVIDEDFGISCTHLYGKILGSHSDASLMDERRNRRDAAISYQAYSITYEHYLEFLAITRDIHQNQLEYYKERKVRNVPLEQLTYPEKGVHYLRRGIKCYIPEEEPSGRITFRHQKVVTFGKASTFSNAQIRQGIIEGAREINASNTCRTTACDILNYTLQYSPNVPSLFVFGFDYKINLVGGQLPQNGFYILPPPPNCFKVNPTQREVLNELYQKLLDLPTNHPNLGVTRQKFDKLKHLYQEIAGEPQLSLNELLTKITDHRTCNYSLFNVRRSRSIFSGLVEALGFKTGTQQAYDRMTKTVTEEIEKEHSATP